MASLFDHLVGTGKQRGRHFEAERLRGLEIDGKIEFGRLLDRDVDRIRAAQNFIDIVAALVTNDVAPLDEMFRNDPRTIRYGATESLYGYEEIEAFRAEVRLSVLPERYRRL